MWCAETGKDPKASHFAMRGAANCGPVAALLTSPDWSECLYYTIRNDGDELLPQEPSAADESSGERR